MVQKRGEMEKDNTKWFYTNLPIEMGQVIDQIVDKKGKELAIFNRQDYIKYAMREQIKKDLASIRLTPALEKAYEESDSQE